MSAVRAYISQAKLRHNVGVLKAHCSPPAGVFAVVKANGYGLDAALVAQSVVDKVDGFAVVSIEEAEQVFPHAGGKTILALRPIHVDADTELIRLAAERQFHCAICCEEALRYVETVLAEGSTRLAIHVQIDTGMGRAGIRPENAAELIRAVQESRLVHLAGVFSHFATADTADLTFAQEQTETFRRFLSETGLDKRTDVIRHLCNSAGTFRVPPAHFDMVRPGMALYGYLCDEFHGQYDLQPVVRVEAPLTQVKAIPTGQTCGYGRTFRTRRDSVIGLVSMGYADGVQRRLSNKGCMRIGPHYVPIIGRVSMDQTIVDLTELPNTAAGMTVIVIDDRIDSRCNVQAIANTVGTICNEIVTSLGPRVQRVLTDLDEGQAPIHGMATSAPTTDIPTTGPEQHHIGIQQDPPHKGHVTPM